VLETCLSGGRLVAVDEVTGLTAFEVDTGEVRWSVPLDRAREEALLHCEAEVILVSLRDGGLVIAGRSPRDGSLLWRTPPRLEPSWPRLGLVAWRAKEGGIGIRWEGHRVWNKGYPPSDEEAKELAHAATGAFRVVEGRVVDEHLPVPTFVTPKVEPPRSLSADLRHVLAFEPGGEVTITTLDGAAKATVKGTKGLYGSRLFVMDARVVHLWTAAIDEPSREARRFETRVEVVDLQGHRLWSRRLRGWVDRGPVP
jgi:hypothetical protein